MYRKRIYNAMTSSELLLRSHILWYSLCISIMFTISAHARLANLTIASPSQEANLTGRLLPPSTTTLNAAVFANKTCGVSTSANVIGSGNFNLIAPDLSNQNTSNSEDLSFRLPLLLQSPSVSANTAFVARVADELARGILKHRARTLELRIVCDDAFIRAHNNSEPRAMRRLNLALGLVSQILQCQLNVQLTVRSVMVRRTGIFAARTRLVPQENQRRRRQSTPALDSASVVLQQYAEALFDDNRSTFRITRAASTGAGNTDAIHFVTGRTLAENVRGLADVEGACDPGRAISLSSDAGADTPVDLAMVMLHEIGHVMGMRHREPGCQCIMSPQLRANAASGFDLTSRAEAEAFFRFGGRCIAPRMVDAAGVAARDLCLAEGGKQAAAKALRFEANGTNVAFDGGIVFPERSVRINSTTPSCSSIFHLRACRSQTECNGRCPGWRCVPPGRPPLASIAGSATPATVTSVVGSCQPARLWSPCILPRVTRGNGTPLRVLTEDFAADDECGAPLKCCNATSVAQLRAATSSIVGTARTGTCLFFDSPLCLTT